MKKRHMSHHRPSKNRGAPLAPTVAELPAPLLMKVLCILSFIAAVLGLVLGYAGDSANRYLLLDHGGTLVSEYLLWEEHGFPIQKEMSNYSQLFTDRLLPMLFAMLFGNPYVAVYLTSIVNWSVMALGTFLLARRCGIGGGAWLAFPLVGLMALLVVVDATEEIFVTAIAYGFRGGLNAILPLMFWLALSILFAPSPKIAIRYAVAFIILFALLKFGYVIVSVWLTLPIVLTVLLALLGRWLRLASINWKILMGALVVGHLLESALHQTIVSVLFMKEVAPEATDATAWLRLSDLSLRQFFVNWGGNIIVKHPLLSLLWVGFLVLSLWAVYVGCFRQTKKQAVPAPILCAVSFLLLAIILGMVAAVALGKFYLWGRWWHFANHRYFMPSIYIPLFLGIPTLLAFYLPILRRRFVFTDTLIVRSIYALAAIVLVCALPLFRYLPQLSNLAIYKSPFLACASNELEKRNLTTGIGPVMTGGYVATHLHAQGIEIVPMYNTRAVVETYQRQEFPTKQPPFRPYSTTDKVPKNIEFVIANSTDEYKTMLAPEISRCPWRLENPRECYDYEWTPHAEWFISAEQITDYYGTPKDVFRCEGVDFYVYKT